MDKIQLSGALKDLIPLNVNPLKHESYQTDINTATETLLTIDSLCSFSGRNVADMGCGNGILGIGSSLLGAGKVDLYDIDENALEACSKNILSTGLKNCTVIKKDMFDVSERYDMIISNPPFGFQTYFSIESMIAKFMEISDNFFFIYKNNAEIRSIARKNSAGILELGSIKLGRTARFHKKESHSIPIVLFYRLSQNN